MEPETGSGIEQPARTKACIRIARYLEARRLRLHPRKTLVTPSAEAATFLGFVLMPGGRRRLPEENVRRFRNRLRGLRDRWRARRVAPEEVRQRVGSWIAHAEHADTWRLRQSIFRDGVGAGLPPIRQVLIRLCRVRASG